MIRSAHWILFLAAAHTWPGWAILLGIVVMIALEWLRRRLWVWQLGVIGK